MRPVKRSILLFVMCSALGTAACGGDDDDDGGTTPDGGTAVDSGSDTPDAGSGVDPAGEDHTFVIDDVIAPASNPEVDMYGLDVDGDGDVDNKLGGLFALLAGLELNVQAVVREQVARGGIILLANLKATDLLDADGVGLYVYLGTNPNPAPCDGKADKVCGNHLQGDGTFDISPDSPDDAFIVGENQDGTFTGGPGTVTIELSLAGGTEPLAIQLISARAEASVSEEALASGKLGGAITDEAVQNDLIPAVAVIVNGIIAEEPTCVPGGATCCEPGSTAQDIIEFLDADGDCQVSAEEIATSAVASFLAPDLDLLADVDGLDAISLGIGFSAVPGTFAVP